MAAALHVTNGDATDVPGTGLAERVLVWFDVLHEGPVPAVGYDELRRIRASFVAQGAGVDPDAVLRRFTARDELLAANRDGDYVLWFEADLYDQLQLVEVLSRLAELGVPPHRITLICIGEYPGIAHFGGLGELRAGARVLAGDADHVALNGVDRWIGGVHLNGRDARWRWDEGTERITAT